MRIPHALAVGVAVGIVLAGVVAAGALLYWLPQGHGQYSGSQLPYTTSSGCSLSGRGSWCSQGFHVNASAFQATDCFATPSTVPTAVAVSFMNSSEYHAFSVNETLSSIGNQTIPGCWSHASNEGPGPFWFVYMDTIDSAVDVNYTVSVTVA
jgi:hypothetical protein